MNLIIERLNGTQYNTKDYGLKVLDFRVESPNPKTIIEEIEGRSGFVDMGTTYEGRILTASFFVTAFDALDFPLLRNEIFKIFDSREAFHLIDDREGGKRWKVKCNESFTPEQIIAHLGRFEASFISERAYVESVGTTLDPKTFDEGVWQVGQGLTVDETAYVHNTITFSIYNAGDIAIDPRELPLKITYNGASTNLKITNDTNGNLWSYTGTTIASDSIVLDGVRSLKNGTSIFSSTNTQLITLEPGWNNFTLTGATDPFTIEFDFRFYYF